MPEKLRWFTHWYCGCCSGLPRPVDRARGELHRCGLLQYDRNEKQAERECPNPTNVHFCPTNKLVRGMKTFKTMETYTEATFPFSRSWRGSEREGCLSFS